jgi:hypothetical protein
MDIKDYPPYSTIAIVRNGQRQNWNVQDYIAQPDDVIIMVLTPADRAALG